MNPYIEVENKSNIELDLSGWRVRGVTHTASITDGTILLPSKKLKLSPRVTAMTFADIQTVALLNPSGVVVSTYPEKAVEAKSASTTSAKEVEEESGTQSTDTDDTGKSATTKVVLGIKKAAPVVNLNTLTASAAGAIPSEDKESDTKKSPSPLYPYLGFFAVLIVGASVTIVLQKKGLGSLSEEGLINAEDITILD